ncbi:hypothetical protein F5051DRAFT_454746 [Lentinula edodes]|nr:hypothetical protein F5051DRAFT_454746 [Lentinula edodes]
MEYHTTKHWVVGVVKNSFSLLWGCHFIPLSLCEDDVLVFAAVQLVRRPNAKPLFALKPGQSWIHKQKSFSSTLPYPFVSIDFYYTPERSKASASLREFVYSYYVVAQQIRRHTARYDSGMADRIARINFGQTLWVALLKCGFRQWSNDISHPP